MRKAGKLGFLGFSVGTGLRTVRRQIKFAVNTARTVEDAGPYKRA